MISTHILDQTLGMPAADVKVSLDKRSNDTWTQIDEQKTNNDGRISFNCESETGVYRLTFDIDPYFKKLNQENFFLRTPLIFQIKDANRKYHVPLLLNPYGYSTYRGS